jgi:lactate permease
MLLGWVFTSFLQGVGGFGVPVAVVAPLLVGLGLPALTAVVVPSLGHAWAVSFGSLGSSFIALTGVTGLDADFLAPPTAILLGIGAVACGVAVAFVAGKWRGLWQAFPALLFMGGIMAIVQYVVATIGLWNIASGAAGLAGLAAGLWVAHWPMYRKGAAETPSVTSSSAPSFPWRSRPMLCWSSWRC